MLAFAGDVAKDFIRATRVRAGTSVSVSGIGSRIDASYSTCPPVTPVHFKSPWLSFLQHDSNTSLNYEEFSNCILFCSYKLHMAKIKRKKDAPGSAQKHRLVRSPGVNISPRTPLALMPHLREPGAAGSRNSGLKRDGAFLDGFW